MLITSKIRNEYAQIQKQLFHMIPEKWDRVYLYASVVERFNQLQTGEMFFYYYPKSMIRRNPVNVYEVPNKFNIDEGAYLRLADKLYGEIKMLREIMLEIGERPWSNMTISIEDFKFHVRYSYEDLVDSNYTSYDRHLIWRHRYLGVSLSSYSRKERAMIEAYLKEEETINQNVNTYSEGIYRKPVATYNIEYNKEEQEIKSESSKLTKEEKEEETIEIKNQILSFGEFSSGGVKEYIK